jgi:hypothetical protein
MPEHEAETPPAGSKERVRRDARDRRDTDED